MPIYAYRCSKCGDETEIMQSMSDAPLKRCKKCRGALRRVYHPVGISFKGSGFYRTDSRSSRKTSDEKRESSGEKSDKREKSDKSDKKSKDSGKSDSKSSSSE